MKKFNKVLALFLALVMIMATMSVAVFAEETDPSVTDEPAAASTGYTIAITGDDAHPTTGHVFQVYQLYTFTIDAGGATVSNVKYGTAGLKGVAADATGDVKAAGTNLTQAELNALDEVANAETYAQGIINNYGTKGLTAYATLNADNSFTVTGAPAGYYLIVDTTEGAPEGDTNSNYILQVISDLNIAPKNSTTTSDKTVADINDSIESAATTGKNTADYDIGDEFQFTLTATLADNVSAYTSNYYVELQDKMCKGLTFVQVDSVTVTPKEGAEIDLGTADYTLNTAATFGNSSDDALESDTGATCFSVRIEDVKKISGLTDPNGATVTVVYTAKLNENAEVGATGNRNEYTLKYNRNPYSEQDGYTKTVINVVFTYRFEASKLDQNKEPLAGAGFTLSKFYLDESGDKTVKVKDGTYTGTWKEVGKFTAEAVTDSEGNVVSYTGGVDGIDDGIYMLEETTVPTGYSGIDPQYFMVTASHDDDELKLVDLSGEAVNDSTIGLETIKKDGNLTGVSTKIVNDRHISLPTTGGVGTTMFYIIGALLVCGAGIVLVTKARMKKA